MSEIRRKLRAGEEVELLDKNTGTSVFVHCEARGEKRVTIIVTAPQHVKLTHRSETEALAALIHRERTARNQKKSMRISVLELI